MSKLLENSQYADRQYTAMGASERKEAENRVEEKGMFIRKECSSFPRSATADVIAGKYFMSIFDLPLLPLF